MVKFQKIDEMPVDSSAFGGLVDYRHVYSSDDIGKHSPRDYEKDSERYTKGYTIARFSSAKISEGAKSSEQPLHSHETRDLFIIGLKGRRTMVVDGKKYEIVPGTYVYIEPGESHRTLNVGRESWETLEFWRALPHDDERFFEEKALRTEQ